MNKSSLKDFILQRMPGIAGLAAALIFEIIIFVFNQITSTKKAAVSILAAAKSANNSQGARE